MSTLVLWAGGRALIPKNAFAWIFASLSFSPLVTRHSPLRLPSNLRTFQLFSRRAKRSTSREHQKTSRLSPISLGLHLAGKCVNQDLAASCSVILRCRSVRSPGISGRVMCADGLERGVVLPTVKGIQRVTTQDIYIVHLD